MVDARALLRDALACPVGWPDPQAGYFSYSIADDLFRATGV
jgi:hypothetical protein